MKQSFCHCNKSHCRIKCSFESCSLIIFIFKPRKQEKPKKSWNITFNIQTVGPQLSSSREGHPKLWLLKVCWTQQISEYKAVPVDNQSDETITKNYYYRIFQKPFVLQIMYFPVKSVRIKTKPQNLSLKYWWFSEKKKISPLEQQLLNLLCGLPISSKITPSNKLTFKTIENVCTF